MSVNVSCVPHACASLIIRSSLFSSVVSGIPDIRKHERLEYCSASSNLSSLAVFSDSKISILSESDVIWSLRILCSSSTVRDVVIIAATEFAIAVTLT